ncbi:MAG: hypothetical protein HYX60_08210 [Legionella longbeachae]|nr:hypothetical protein [Legionella longbeachae]
MKERHDIKFNVNIEFSEDLFFNFCIELFKNQHNIKTLLSKLSVHDNFHEMMYDKRIILCQKISNRIETQQKELEKQNLKKAMTVQNNAETYEKKIKILKTSLAYILGLINKTSLSEFIQQHITDKNVYQSKTKDFLEAVKQFDDCSSYKQNFLLGELSKQIVLFENSLYSDLMETLEDRVIRAKKQYDHKPKNILNDISKKFLCYALNIKNDEHFERNLTTNIENIYKQPLSYLKKKDKKSFKLRFLHIENSVCYLKEEYQIGVKEFAKKYKITPFRPYLIQCVDGYCILGEKEKIFQITQLQNIQKLVLLFNKYKTQGYVILQETDPINQILLSSDSESYNLYIKKAKGNTKDILLNAPWDLDTVSTTNKNKPKFPILYKCEDGYLLIKKTLFGHPEYIIFQANKLADFFNKQLSSDQYSVIHMTEYKPEFQLLKQYYLRPPAHKIKNIVEKQHLLEVNEKSRFEDKILNVVYFTDKDRAKFQIITHDGLFKQNAKNFSTTNMCSHFKKNFASFTLNKQGELSLFSHLSGEKDKQDKVISHSSMNAGKKVIFTGEIQIENGVLLAITTYSGHYRPSLYNIYRLLEHFVNLGIDISKTKILTSHPINQGSKNIVWVEEKLTHANCLLHLNLNYETPAISILLNNITNLIKNHIYHTTKSLSIELKNLKSHFFYEDLNMLLQFLNFNYQKNNGDIPTLNQVHKRLNNFFEINFNNYIPQKNDSINTFYMTLQEMIQKTDYLINKLNDYQKQLNLYVPESIEDLEDEHLSNFEIKTGMKNLH